MNSLIVIVEVFKTRRQAALRYIYTSHSGARTTPLSKLVSQILAADQRDHLCQMYHPICRTQDISRMWSSGSIELMS